MEDLVNEDKLNDNSLNSKSSDAQKIVVPKKRGRKKLVKRGRKMNGNGGSMDTHLNINGDGQIMEDDNQKKQEKIDKRKELLRQHLEEVKWQAVDKILNEKSKKEREKEKKLKRELEDTKAKEAATEEKRKQALSNIHIKHSKDGQVSVSFPRGFLLPKVLSQEKPNGNSKIINNISLQACMKCGKQSKYCNPASKKHSCSLKCYKELS